MPYIEEWPNGSIEGENRRRELNPYVYGVPNPETPGEMNYMITMIIINYLFDKGPTYTTYNMIMGVLESVKQEFYRRVVVPYEDQKIKENGDVY